MRITFVMAEGETTAFAYEGRLTKLSGIFPYTGIYKLKELPQVIQENASRARSDSFNKEKRNYVIKLQNNVPF